MTFGPRPPGGAAIELPEFPDPPEIPVVERIDYAMEPMDEVQTLYSSWAYRTIRGRTTFQGNRRSPRLAITRFGLARDYDANPVILPDSAPPDSEIWALYIPNSDAQSFLRHGVFSPHLLYSSTTFAEGASTVDNNFEILAGVVHLKFGSDSDIAFGRTATNQLLVGLSVNIAGSVGSDRVASYTRRNPDGTAGRTFTNYPPPRTFGFLKVQR